MQRTRNTATRASQAGRAAPGAAAAARAEAVAAAASASAAGEAPAGKVEPLLSLARALVRHAKVTKWTAQQEWIPYVAPRVFY